MASVVTFAGPNHGSGIGINYGSVRNEFHLPPDLDEKLSIEHGAIFGSYVDQHEDECLPGTRSDIFRQIEEWSLSLQGKLIFWLNGMAGTGKSTIARTMARHFSQTGSLGGSFFFKTGEGDRGSAKKLFPTIARQLAISIPQVIPFIHNSIREDPGITSKAMREQFEKLLILPFQSVQQFDPIRTIVIVIDALDECEGDDDIRLILQLLPRLQGLTSIRIRVLLTSRPERPIRLGFSTIAQHDYISLVLQDVPSETITHDISLFLNHRLSEIRQEREPPLPCDWPGITKIQSLVALSIPSFIFAATICRVLKDPNWDPYERLSEILEYRHDGSILDRTYLPILDRLLRNQQEKQKQELVSQFKKVVGAIDTNSEICEFLHDAKRFIQKTSQIADNAPLQIYLSGLIFAPVKSIIRKQFEREVPNWMCTLPQVQVTWSADIQTLEGHSSCVECVTFSPNGRLLASGSRDFMIRIWDYGIGALQHTLDGNLGPVSALVFSPDGQLLVAGSDKSVQIWDPITGALQHTLSGHLDDIRSVAFSHDGKLLASGSRDKTVRLWDPVTGALQQILRGHSGCVQSLVISSDGQLLASASNDETIKLWNLSTGTLQRTLKGYLGWA
ncbi:NACHT and WD40 domain protein [Penicillium herquei]|nr:NACHT and WD40 domain protein [Penicillium herquei]